MNKVVYQNPKAWCITASYTWKTRWKYKENKQKKQVKNKVERELWIHLEGSGKKQKEEAPTRLPPSQMRFPEFHYNKEKNIIAVKWHFRG